MAVLPVPASKNTPRADAPLGTAAWFAFPEGDKPSCRSGDFFLSRLPSGEAVGVKDDRHILLVSGTRAGKGTSIIVPNLCYWPGSTVVIDPKGENALITARRRGKGSPWCTGLGQVVRILDPMNEVRRSGDDFAELKACFNPLDLLPDSGEEAIDIAARIADALIVSETSSDPYWAEAARTALKGVILHVASWRDYPQDARTLITVHKLMRAGDAELKHLIHLGGGEDEPSGHSLLFRAMCGNPAYDGVIEQTGAMLADLERNSPRTFASIMQVACTNLDFIDSPDMKRCLARSDFALDGLKTSRTGESLFLCLPQRYMTTHHRWLRMMTTLIIGEMERRRALPASGHPVLIVLDEFPALRRMRTIENAAAQIAGFGVKMVFVAQTLAQLKDIYKDNWETLVANCGIKLFFGNDDHFTREYVSKLVGDCEVVRTPVSRAEMRGSSSSTASGRTTGTSSTYTIGGSSGASAGAGGASSKHGYSWSSTHGTSHSTSLTQTTGNSRSQTDTLTESVHKRALITPDEVGRLFGDRSQPTALALLSGMQPLALTRVWYYSDHIFTGWFDPHPDHEPPPTLAHREKLRLAAAQKDKERAERLRREQDARRRLEQAARLAHLQAERTWRRRAARLVRRIAEWIGDTVQEVIDESVEWVIATIVAAIFWGLQYIAVF